MRQLKVILFCLFLVSASFYKANSQQTNIELGDGFYFYYDTSNSEVLYKPSYKDTTIHYFSQRNIDLTDSISLQPIPRVLWVVVSNVRYIGRNTNYVLLSSSKNLKHLYWLIDKTKSIELTQVYNLEERVILSNVSKINRRKFKKFKRKLDLEELNYPGEANNEALGNLDSN